FQPAYFLRWMNLECQDGRIVSIIARLEFGEEHTQSRDHLTEKCVVKVDQVSACTFSVCLQARSREKEGTDKTASPFLTNQSTSPLAPVYHLVVSPYPIDVDGKKVKIRVARTSFYIEIYLTPFDFERGNKRQGYFNHVYPIHLSNGKHRLQPFQQQQSGTSRREGWQFIALWNIPRSPSVKYLPHVTSRWALSRLYWFFMDAAEDSGPGDRVKRLTARGPSSDPMYVLRDMLEQMARGLLKSPYFVAALLTINPGSAGWSSSSTGSGDGASSFDNLMGSSSSSSLSSSTSSLPQSPSMNNNPSSGSMGTSSPPFQPGPQLIMYCKDVHFDPERHLMVMETLVMPCTDKVVRLAAEKLIGTQMAVVSLSKPQVKLLRRVLPAAVEYGRASAGWWHDPATCNMLGAANAGITTRSSTSKSTAGGTGTGASSGRASTASGGFHGLGGGGMGPGARSFLAVDERLDLVDAICTCGLGHVSFEFRRVREWGEFADYFVPAMFTVPFNAYGMKAPSSQPADKHVSTSSSARRTGGVGQTESSQRRTRTGPSYSAKGSKGRAL
ncbi:hypothetical protein HDU76_009276, partial [Blyttiomyces sp. JEL0837]